MPRLKRAPDFIDTTGIESFRYWSDAKLYAPVDGDTADIHVRLGYHAAMESVRFRLARINAPELNKKDPQSTPEGLASLNFLNYLIKDKVFVIQSIKTRKGWAKKGGYGRYLAEIYVPEDDGYTNVNNKMVATGHADWYDR